MRKKITAINVGEVNRRDYDYCTTAGVLREKRLRLDTDTTRHNLTDSGKINPPTDGQKP
jgi:hypothetical protein